MNKSLYNQCLANPEPIRILGILSCRPWSKTTVGSTVEKPVFLIRTAKPFFQGIMKFKFLQDKFIFVKHT